MKVAVLALALLTTACVRAPVSTTPSPEVMAIFSSLRAQNDSLNQLLVGAQARLLLAQAMLARADEAMGQAGAYIEQLQAQVDSLRARVAVPPRRGS